MASAVGQRLADRRQASLFQVGAIIDLGHSQRNGLGERVAGNAAAAVKHQRHVHLLPDRRQMSQIEIVLSVQQNVYVAHADRQQVDASFPHKRRRLIGIGERTIGRGVLSGAAGQHA